MRPNIGEHYHFEPPLTGAGVIKRHTGKDMIIRHMLFEKGFCIGEDSYCYHFETMIGNTTYHFIIGKYGNAPLTLRKRPPRLHK